jgi:fructose-specific phosphotransferase system IIC component
MEWQWAGLVPLLFMILITGFIAGVLYLLLKALRLITSSHDDAKQRAIYKPIFGMMVYSLVWLLVRQLIDFGFVVYTNPTYELATTAVLSGIYVVFGMAVLYRVLYVLELPKS